MDNIGSKMTSNCVTVRKGMNVRQAMRELVRQAAENDNVSIIYVLDESETLIGAIELKELIIARESTALETITEADVPYVYEDEKTSDCIERIRSYSEELLPVIDRSGKFKGVLTLQTITEIAESEFDEDYARLAGLTEHEDLKEPLKKSIKKRLPWLTVLLILGLTVSSVVGIFEGIVRQVSIIVSFQSLILGMAGNAGTQSLAVTIRVLTSDRVSARDKAYLILKEARTGLINGLILGTLSIIVIGVYLLFIKHQPPTFAFYASLCTAIALAVSMALASISGTTIPLIFKRFGIDPAVASGPLITTLNDLVAVVTYYGLAWLLLLF